MRAGRRIHVMLAVAALGCSVGAAALAARSAEPDRVPDGRAQVGPAARPSDGPAPTSPPRGTEPPNPQAGAELRAQARSVGRRFLRAFLRFQAGRLNAATRRELRETSTSALAASLLARPPRLDRSRSWRGRLARVRVVGPYLKRLKVVARVVYPEIGPSLLEAGVRRRGRSVRVARFYP